jgi:enoyl-CoA hydratase
MTTSQETAIVLYEKENHIARVIFNRPEKLNALNPEMYKLLMDYLELARADDDVKVVIIKGAGKSFNAGHDLSRTGFVSGFGYGASAFGEGAAERNKSQRTRLRNDFDNLIRRWRYILLFPKVTIAQVHGYCIGAGRHIAEACDLTLVADDAKISWEDQRHGHAEGSELWSMLHLGPKKSRELHLTGATLSGKEAADLGWASRSVPLDKLESETERIARIIALQPRDGIAIGKAQRQMEFEALGIAHSGTAAVIHTLFTNIHFEDDEVNFYKDRHDLGVKEAMHKVTQAFEKP